MPLNPKSYILHRKSGFTLIELLVVIVIIAILATLLTANFIGVRQRGRDAERKSDIKQIQTALELFRSDYGCYPSGTCPGLAALPTCGNMFSQGSTTYMQKIPCDPLSLGTSYNYSSDATTYCIRSCIENSADSQRDFVTYGQNNPAVGTCILTACSGDQTTSFTVQNP